MGVGMNGKLHMQAVAGIFVAIGVVGVLAQVALLVLGQQPSVVSGISSVAYVIGAYYFLKGSWPAKIFLTAMAALSTLLAGAVGILMLADRSAPIGLFTPLVAAATAYCLYVLLLSKTLKAEFGRRSERARADKAKVAQRYYDELEQGSSGE